MPHTMWLTFGHLTVHYSMEGFRKILEIETDLHKMLSSVKIVNCSSFIVGSSNINYGEMHKI